MPLIQPRADDLAALLSGLLGREVTVRAATGDALALGRAAALAEYGDEGGIAASCAVDLPLGAALGAALAMLPVQRVAEAAGAGALADDLAGNLAEMLTVAGSLFVAEDDAPPLRAVHRPPEPPAPEVVEFAVRAGSRVEFVVDVEDYGGGAWVGLLP